MRLRDTCGVRKLRMAGAAGRTDCSTAVPDIVWREQGPSGKDRHHQAWYISHPRHGGWGTLAAAAMKAAPPSVHKLQTEHLFDDSMWWDEMEEEESNSGPKTTQNK